MDKEKNVVITYQKNADKIRNRIIIPKFFIDKHGREFYMQIFDNYIKLIHVKKKGE